MHQLSRVCLQNWYLIDAEDIEIRGAAALIGPTGSGKSSIQDAIQTVITGVNQNRLNLNPSASGRSGRSVLEYCLGLTRDPAEGGKPLRQSCETVIALVFRDDETDEPITVGVALSARDGDSREEVLSRFIVPGHAYSVNEAKRREGASQTLAPWTDLAASLRERFPAMEEYRTSAEKFTSDMLKAMKGDGQQPNARHFLRAFSNALAFKPIFDPTAFVREYVLEPDPLDVTRVRSSISNWQELERIIEDVEAKLRRMIRLAGRFRDWGRARMRAEAARFAAAAAEARRCSHDVLAWKEALTQKAEALAREKTALATRRQWIRELDEEARAKRVLLESGDGAARARQVEVESKLATRDLREAEERYRRLKEAFHMATRLSPVAGFMSSRQGEAIDAAREALRLMPEGIPAIEAMRGTGERLQRHAETVAALDGLDHTLHEKADELSDRVRRLQEKAERLEGLVSAGSSDREGAILSPHTSRFLSALSRRGMSPIPLCDVVEVVEEDWQYAVEALLGRAREAIIVSPDRLSEAFDLLARERDSFGGSMLVKTWETAGVQTNVRRGSILEAVRTGDPHAMAFMASRIGGFMKAEDENALRNMQRGVMRNGKTSSGMALSVQASLRELLLGKAAREKTALALRNELGPLRDELAQARQAVRLLREAARTVPLILDVLSSGDGPYHLEHTLRSASQRVASLMTTGDGGVQDADLPKEIEAIERDRELYAREVAEEIEPAVERLQGEAATARAKLDVALESLRNAVKARKRAWDALSDGELQRIPHLDPEVDEPGAVAVCREVRVRMKRGETERKDPKAMLASMRNDAKAICEASETEARREQSAAIREVAEYGVQWETEVPKVDQDTMTVGYAWVAGEKARLENNELRAHREACARAAEEMRRMLKEDLLARLSEKLVKVGHRMEALNDFLSRHKFTNQTYTFDSSVDLRFSRMHDLAVKVGGSGEASLADSEVAEAVSELEGMIEGAAGADLLADYRQYFTFEIAMTDAGGSRTTMSSRAVKGSGGEAQAPFYVAIAASLASAYFPGTRAGRPKGMGLALFDEAFNKLDVPNTQALLAFFRDMGLQLMIAGPEDKRATFTEALDTIILVNKSLDGNSVYIDVEYPGDLARQALAEANPDHLGVQAFRRELLAGE